MFEYIKKLSRSRRRYEFDVRDNDVVKLNAAITCVEQKIALAKIRSRKRHKLIDDLRERIRNLSYQLQETKHLAGSEKKNNISCVSADTDLIIDMQNELRIAENRINLLRSLLHNCERQTRELREQHALSNRKMMHSEKRRAQLQILSARAEIAAVRRRIQSSRSNLLSGGSREAMIV